MTVTLAITVILGITVTLAITVILGITVTLAITVILEHSIIQSKPSSIFKG